MKPAKGSYAENLRPPAKPSVSSPGDPPDLVVLPEGALTGYFLEGAVYDVAVDAERYARDLAHAWRSSGAPTPVDIAGGFFENDGGTSHNSAAYVQVEAEGQRIVHVHRKCFCRPTASSTKSAFSRAGAVWAFSRRDSATPRC